MTHWQYGRQTVLEILRSGQPVLKLLVSDSAQKDFLQEVLEAAKERKVPCRVVPKKQIDEVAQGNHQGAAVQVPIAKPVEFKSFLERLRPGKSTFLCLLDDLEDPHNVGAIIRSAVCFGCSGVVIPKRHSAGLSPAAMRSSSGAAAHIPVADIPNLGVAIERLKENGFFILGADASGGNEPLGSTDLDFPLAVVFGNEHRGIKPTIQKACDRLVSIPQSAAVASLNVSNAAAIFFYEISKKIGLSRKRDLI